MKIMRIVELIMWLLCGIGIVADGHITVFAFCCCWVILLLKIVERLIDTIFEIDTTYYKKLYELDEEIITNYESLTEGQQELIEILKRSKGGNKENV